MKIKLNESLVHVLNSCCVYFNLFFFSGTEENTPAPMETDESAGASAKSSDQKVKMSHISIF